MWWVALCFGVSSAVYLSWLDRLIRVLPGTTADWLSMGAGYLCQALGILPVCRLLQLAERQMSLPLFRKVRQHFAAVTALFAVVSVPMLLTDTAAALIAFGMIGNLLIGSIGGFYLYGIAGCSPDDSKELIFGGGYAAATIAVGLLSLIRHGGFLHSRYALLLYLLLMYLMVRMAGPLDTDVFPGKTMDGAAEGENRRPETDGKKKLPLQNLLSLALGTVVLISAVKNMGFSFPSTDIVSGLLPELSRLPYALGLMAMGLITVHDQRIGMLCAVSALITPFIMLGLAGEPVPASVCWGLDYVFFGVFSVFRVALLWETAGRAGKRYLAPLGLAAGRLGDVLGTAAGLLLADHHVVLIALTGACFIPAVYLFFHLYQRLYEPEQMRQRGEQEMFEAFCLHNDISLREKEVLRMVLDGRSNGEIAEALFITVSTVKYHVRNVLQKAGCKNRSELQQKFTLTLFPGLRDNTKEPDEP